MVGGSRADLNSQPCTTRGLKLVGMNFDVQSERSRPGENTPRLVGSEDTWLHKDIAELREPPGGYRVQVVDNAIDEGSAVAGKFCRHRMRAEIRRDDFEWIGGSHRFEHSDLCSEIQSVTALGFDG